MSLQQELIGYWTMDNKNIAQGLIYDSSGYDNHGNISVSSTGVSSVVGQGCRFRGTLSSDIIDISEDAATGSPSNTNEITISSWVRPKYANMDTRGTVCTNNGMYYLQVRSDGSVACYTYNNGGNNSTYFRSTSQLQENIWSHIAFTQDTSGEKRIYINGSLDRSESFTAEIGGSQQLNIGAQGGSRKFNGDISDVRIYKRALSELDIIRLYNMRSQPQGNIEPYQFRPRAGSGPNLMDATQWTVGTNGSQGDFSRNGAIGENSIIEEDTPYGDLAPIWYGRSESTDDSADGGWNHNFDNSLIQTDKKYRYSVWIKQEYNTGTVYHGTGYVANLSGSNDGNPYYWYGVLPTLNKWYLVVGYNHPSDVSGTPNESAIYDINGNKQNVNTTDYKWNSQGSARFRSYYYYDSNVGRGARFYDPRVEVIDGSETPLSAMFNAAQDFSDGRYMIYFDGFEAGNFEPTWNISNATISSTRQFSGTNSFGSWNEGSVEATWTPYDGEKRINQFEYWWKEDSSQTGHVVILYDGNGNQVQESGTENPQWLLNDGSGGRVQISNSGTNYNVWTRFKFDFDWENGEYDYVLEKTDGTHSETGTQPLDNSTGVSEIRFTGAGYGTANYCRFDDVTVKK